ncbi:ArsC/Spx/MgsR family protein [Oceanospirillum sediminis]|uniref:Nitrogenase-associated protein n=1 Tax=Oceanospirillum sediminis TaxID=2760088 RepID=A0A839ISF8_9GAMM|nr:ArsC/Spx/MgsR family protein [Oceanospirillum sediminis]MBB1487594.1 hypothetical protein [Oceanospirillum sediminis]
MKTVIFYEKPGCQGNLKQRQRLKHNGYAIEVKSILSHVWCPASLKAFLQHRPVNEWFNRSAPMIKQGQVNPELLSESDALTLMIKNPLLIRRPLLEYAGEKRCGFDNDVVVSLLQLAPENAVEHCLNRAKQR